MNYVYLSIGWGLFYLFHSYGASDQWKTLLKAKGIDLNYWRIAYSLLSIVGFLCILLFMAVMDDQILWPPNKTIRLVSMIAITYGLIIIRLAFKQSSVIDFLSREDRYEEDATLHLSGVYASVRHPIYSGTILIFIGMVLFITKVGPLVSLIATLIYLVIAIPLEERKLIKKHGDTYLTYKRQVPAIIPNLLKRS